jgi:hypothetical protein
MELNLVPKALPSINGNFEQYKKELTKLITGYKNSPLTEETVAPVKSAIRQMRTTLEKMESTSVAAYFDTPKKILKAQFAELYSIIAEGEDKVDAIIAEDTRKRNEAATIRFKNYIISKTSAMALEKDVVDYVVLEKKYFNVTAKESETLDAIDKQLVGLEKNFAAYIRAEKKINKIAAEQGPTFNKARFLYMLSKYGDNNDTAASLAEEEAERLQQAKKETPVDSYDSSPKQAHSSTVVLETVIISVELPVYDKKTSKGYEELCYNFSVPKDAKRGFSDLLKELKGAGIKATKVVK